MTGIKLPINNTGVGESAVHADIVLGEDWKARRDAMARLLDARLNRYWSIDLSGWPASGATWPTLDISGFGGPIVDENGVIANGSDWGPLTLADDETNFVERTHAGVVSATTGGFTPDTLGMYEITTVSGEITAIVDHRVQASVPNLAAALLAIRALTPAADQLPYFDGASSAALTGLSVFMRTVLDDVDGSAAATTLGVLRLAGGTLTGYLTLHADPSSAMHAVTKQYVDALLAALTAGFDFKDNVRVATTAPINLATDLENGDTIDGVVLVTGDRVLVKDQAAPEENGIYLVPASGAASRTTDADSWNDLVAAFLAVSEGTANEDTLWLSTANAGGTLGVTAVTWTQPFAGAGEANTASNVGGEAEVFKQKSGVDLEFRTIKAGTNITVTQNANDIEIASTGGGSAGGLSVPYHLGIM